MAEQQAVALSGDASKEFALNPSLEHENPAHDLIERELFMEWIQPFEYKRWIDATDPYMATPLQSKQLTYLHLAVLQPYSQDGADQRRRNDWAKSLLVKYMLASGRLYEDEVFRASLDDLRMVMLTVLGIFDADPYRGWVKLFFNDAALPLDFEEDVYPGLGWGYGKLLTRAFKRCTSQGHVHNTLAHQWLKESSMWS